MVPNMAPAPSAAMIPTAALPGESTVARSGNGKNRRAANNRESAAQHLRPFLETRAAQFLEQQPTPEEAHQAVGIPERKGNRETYVTNRKDGQRVANCPQHSGKHRPHNQVRLVAQVIEQEALCPSAVWEQSSAPRMRPSPYPSR